MGHLRKLPLLPMERPPQSKSAAAVLPIAFKDLVLIKCLPHGQLRKVLDDGHVFVPQTAARPGDVPFQPRPGEHGDAGKPPNVHGCRIQHGLRRSPRRNGLPRKGFVIFQVPCDAGRKVGKPLLPHAVDKVGIGLNQPICRFGLRQTQKRLHRLGFQHIFINGKAHKLCPHDFHGFALPLQIIMIIYHGKMEETTSFITENVL